MAPDAFPASYSTVNMKILQMNPVVLSLGQKDTVLPYRHFFCTLALLCKEKLRMSNLVKTASKNPVSKLLEKSDN